MKRYIQKNKTEIKKRIYAFLFHRSLAILFVFILLMLLSSSIILAQDKQLNYNVVRNGNVVGWIRLEKFNNGSTTQLKLTSEINTRFIFKFTARGQEEATFREGRMISSALFRKLNGNVKANKHAEYTGNGYAFTQNGKTEIINVSPVPYNLLCLYFEEPRNKTEVWSDNFQQFVKIEKSGENIYKMKFPEGNSNYYYYKNGELVKVKVDHPFYSAELVLVK